MKQMNGKFQVYHRLFSFPFALLEHWSEYIYSELATALTRFIRGHWTIVARKKAFLQMTAIFVEQLQLRVTNSKYIGVM